MIQYPVITAHHASRDDILNREPNMLTSSTNRNLLQPTKANRARRKSRIQSIQHSADKGKHRAPNASPSSSDNDTPASKQADTKDKRGRARAESKSSNKSKPKQKSRLAAFFSHDAGNDDSDSGASARSQLVDLIVEDQEAEELDRVRARKEGSPEWNRSEPRRYV